MFFFFFNDTATTEIYTLSLHDALPIFHGRDGRGVAAARLHDAFLRESERPHAGEERPRDRKSTRLNSSHLVISYAVFCLKKKNTMSSHTIDPCTIITPPCSLNVTGLHR